MTNNNDSQLENLFEQITANKVVLITGAGAAVGSKKMLSKELMNYYRDEENIAYQSNDIVEFVDKVFSNGKYSRNHFDSLVVKYLRRLKVENYHKVISSINWKAIITTNVDMLIEQAFIGSDKRDSLDVIRNLKEWDDYIMSSKLKYIKLHGCISDISNYDLKFSSQDFKSVEKYYRKLFGRLKSISPDVKFLFIGHSLKDAFGNFFLEEFLKELDHRNIYYVDPYIDEINQSFLESKGFKIIKEDSDAFFGKFSKWEEKFYETNIKSRSKFRNVFKSIKGVESKLLYKVESFVKPLNLKDFSTTLSRKDFYLGAEPDFSIVCKNYDVVKTDKLQEINKKILEQFKNIDTIYPLIYLYGSYGTGKTTFTYRIINLLLHTLESTIALEITDFLKLDIDAFKNFIESIKFKNILIFSNYSELDFNFKNVRQLRSRLSSFQLYEKNIVFIQSIRENVLKSFEVKHKPQIVKFNIDVALNENEISLLLDYLKNESLVEFRDGRAKRDIIKYLNSNFSNSDQYLILLDLIKGGKHKQSLIDTYNKLTDNCKQAFLFTSLLYRHNILMPFSWLQKILKMNWEVFVESIIRMDGHGILIQENIESSQYLEPDIYFRTKHAMISDTLITYVYKGNKDKEYRDYQSIVKSIDNNRVSSKIIIDLFKALSTSKTFNLFQISKLYDLAFDKFYDDFNFTINYSLNIEKRRTIKNLEKALNIIKDFDDYNENRYYRNPILIHRKAVLNGKLFREHFINEDFSISKEYYDDAIDLFEIKQIIDPSSSYSYYDYIKIYWWYLSKIKLSDEEKSRIEFNILNLFELATDNLHDGIEKIKNLQVQFEKTYNKDQVSIQKRIDEMYQKEETRPYALILKYYKVRREGNEFPHELILEMEEYNFNLDVLKLLYKIYCDNLHEIEYRLKFYEINKVVFKNNAYKPIEYYFYDAVADYYSFQFESARKKLVELKNEFSGAILSHKVYWLDEDEESMVFPGKIDRHSKGKFLIFKPNKFGGSIWIKVKSDLGSKLDKGQTKKAKIRFTYSGLVAEIV
ncbi:SIR2 family protein [Lacinutrix iliipiscaria]|uniref:SIR2 family protein n=1 Tax=Lacinutrix iliipiscaria TaxID=1230532 RepID=A0ABW5WNF5_9FLAO